MATLISLALWGALLFLVMRFGCGAHAMGQAHGRQDGRGQDNRSGEGRLRWVAPETDVDPVCGKTVRTGQAKSAVNDGMVHSFCSRECRERFEAAPEIYLARGNASRLALEHSHV